MIPKIRQAAAVALSVIAFSGVHAASETSERAEARYRTAMERCQPMRGNAQDVCEKDAKAAREKARAGERAARKGTPEARMDARESTARAEYRAAKERCDSLRGKEQTACESNAKAVLDRQQADAERKRKSN